MTKDYKGLHKRLRNAHSGGICFWCGAPLIRSSFPPSNKRKDISWKVGSGDYITKPEWDRGVKGVLRGGVMHYKATIDHLIPSSQGGETHSRNCVLSCPVCNETKSDLSVRDFLIIMLGQPNTKETEL